MEKAAQGADTEGAAFPVGAAMAMWLAVTILWVGYLWRSCNHRIRMP